MNLDLARLKHQIDRAPRPLNEADVQDLVVIAGKGHEQEQIIGRERLPFSDRHIVQRIIGIAQ